MNSKTYIVFDFDGTLVDTQRYHAKIESDYLKSYGIDIAPELISKTYAGRTPSEWISEVLNNNGHTTNLGQLHQFEIIKNQTIIDLSNQGGIKLLLGVKDFIDSIKDNLSIILGISSGTSVLALEELIPLFKLPIQFYTSADEVTNKKPAPDVFEKTFDKMGATQEDKRVVIGDGLSDVIGGRAAGAKTIFVNTDIDKGKVVNPDLMINSFKELDIDKINGLF